MLARCNFCGLRYTVDLPTEQQLETLYQGLYSDEGAYAMHLDEVQQVKETGKNKPGRYRSKIFLQRYRPQPGDRLLDVGCGVGTFMMAAEAQGWRVEGIELSDSAVRASNKIHNIPVQIGDFLQIDLEPGAFRAIVAWEVLEHLPNPRAFVAKARRLLSPGGVLACSVPNEGSKVPSPPVRGPASVPPVHLNFWDTDSLNRFFEINGFRVERIIPQRSMLSCTDPHQEPLRFARLQAGALLGVHQGIHLFAAATPIEKA